jgi:phosphoglycolate phosphatase
MSGKDNVALVMFDLDGTLVNSVDAIINSVNVTRKKFHYSARAESEIFELVGLAPSTFFSDLDISDSDVQKLIDDFRFTLNGVQFDSSHVYPSTGQALKTLQSYGAVLAVATNKPTKNAELLLNKTGLISFFTHIQGSDNLNSKPAPDILIKVMTMFNPDSSVMVGDRAEDMIAARSIGVKCIGLAQTSHSKDLLLESGASLAFNTMSSFCEFVESSDLSVILR